MNRICVIINKQGDFDGIVSDEPIEAYIIQVSCLPDPVCDYTGSVDVSRERIQELIEIEPRDRPSKPTFTIVPSK